MLSYKEIIALDSLDFSFPFIYFYLVQIKLKVLTGKVLSINFN